MSAFVDFIEAVGATDGVEDPLEGPLGSNKLKLTNAFLGNFLDSGS